jgi:hypothetical protein
MAFSLEDGQLEKKVNKNLKALWPEFELDQEAIQSEHLIGDEQAFRLFHEEELIGYYLIDKAKSKFDLFDFMVVFDTEGSIIRPSVLIYREDYGGEICSKRWLKQFIGLDSDSDMRLGHEVQNISGATMSCDAASRGFKIASERIKAIIDG